MALAKLEDETTTLLRDVDQQQYSLLHRFVEESPIRPYCCDEKGALVIRQRKYAFRKKRIQHNPPSMCQWMTFDLDHGNPMIFKDSGLPAPNLIVMTRASGHSHISYAIEGVCTSDAARHKPLSYLSAIQDSYCKALSADVGYTNFITKNPLHHEWDVTVYHDHVYSLGELADYVELAKKRWTRKQAANDSHHGYGRNCALFHRLRFWAYDHVIWHRENGTNYNEWMREVLSRCEGFNEFAEALPYHEVKSTAKSVGKWVWTKYQPSYDSRPVRRGLMSETFKQSDLPLSLETKQRLSARRTAETKRSGTEEKIINAIGDLTAAGKKVSKAAVSTITGIHRNSLGRNYSHLFKS